MTKGIESTKPISGGNELLSTIVGLSVRGSIVTATPIEKIECNYSDEIANSGAHYSFITIKIIRIK